MTTVTLNLPESATSRDVLVETACRLYDAERLTKTEACRLCGLTRVEFERELASRGLSIVKMTQESVESDLRQAGINLDDKRN